MIVKIGTNAATIDLILLFSFHVIALYFMRQLIAFKKVGDWKACFCGVTKIKGFGLFAYFLIPLLMFLKVFLNIKIQLDFLAEIIFAIIFSLSVVVTWRDVNVMDKKIILMGQLILTCIIEVYYLVNTYHW